MASLNGKAEVQQPTKVEGEIYGTGPKGGLSTIEEETDDDQDMVGPVVPRARKRRVSTVMAYT